MKKLFKVSAILCFVFFIFILTIASFESENLPVEINVTEGTTNVELNSVLPLTANIDTNKFFRIDRDTAENDKTYKAQVKLMNIVPVKNVEVKVVEEKTVVPCGEAFGVKIFTKGVVIVGMPGVKTEQGLKNPTDLAGLKIGDAVLAIDGKEVDSNETVERLVGESAGKTLSVDAKRNDMTFNVKLNPVKCVDDNHYRAGILVRDSSAGIGIMTFFDPDTGQFAGLGHAICDVEIGEPLPLNHGEIVSANISGVTKGGKGMPGELKGHFTNQNAIGTLDFNANTGVYGRLKIKVYNEEKIPVAMKQQVRVGDAKIISTVRGEKKEEFAVRIRELNYKKNSPTKNMVVEITDPELLKITGGIVQGMSGSPLIQNGMLVGALTHVFLNDSKCGYAIFAENMLNKCKNMYKDFYDEVS
ncbi:MAG: SpoIVB peptidase [Oscillospiraceae bacterium]|jgi:stage IV sporulation protein B|nr:SpoIVB peptidase [Oscillospiraceae bacterium]